jgi:branched-chain amino acid transport system ATP-binding protein
MLNLKNIVVRYDGVQALKNVSIDVQKGSITGLIGANGAGKSSMLKAISGLVPITSGEIWFEGKRIDGKEPEKIVELGIGHVPEGKQLFLEMSVEDNLLTGAHLRKDHERVQQDLERIYAYFPVLRGARHRRASTLSGGEQQMLAIGRGLMSNPKLLLLDEPSLGLSPILTSEVGSIIKRIADEGVSILLIEQNANLALQLAKQNYVMETGTIALQGDSKELQNNDHVRAAYLGISPTEERPSISVPDRQMPKSGILEGRPPERWQDRGPQGRWQGEKTPGRRAQEGLVQYKEPLAREIQDIRVQDKEVEERWAQETRTPKGEFFDRWTLDIRTPDRERPDRWVKDRRVQDKELPDRWTAGREPPSRWVKGREAPSRIVKKTFVPPVQSKT